MMLSAHKTIFRCFLTMALAGAFMCACASRTIDPHQDRVDVEKLRPTVCPNPEDATCFSQSPLGTLVGKAFSGQGGAPQYVSFLSRGDEALIARVHLIRSARRSILFQTFIWGDDEASSFFFLEMYRAAERGVKVQIIVDQMGAKAQIDSLRQAAVAHENLEIKLYNPVRGKAKLSSRDMANAAATQFRQLNQRMHNKILVVDNRIGITGGRNIENKYFDLDPVYTFKDRDVLVIGPVVNYMKRSFVEYWQYEQSIPLAEVSGVLPEAKQDREKADSENLEAYYETIYGAMPALEDYSRQASNASYIEETFVREAFEVDGRIMFHADNPGKVAGDENSWSELTTREVENVFLETRNSLVMQTPYLVFSKQSLKFLKTLRKRNPEFEIIASSNSLAAADHIHVYGVAFKQKKKLVKNLQFRIYELKPVPGDVRQMIPRYDALSELKNEKGLADTESFLPSGTGTRVGIHSKSMVLDDSVAWIGSHNFDPRSENLNTEAGVMIWDEAVAGRLKSEILLDCAPRNSWLVAKRKQVPVISYFSGIMGSISRALPVFDIWPFRYTTSYELNEGMAPVPPGHPDFYRNYTDKKAFPGINLSGRAMQTRLITAMGGFITPYI